MGVLVFVLLAASAALLFRRPAGWNERCAAGLSATALGLSATPAGLSADPAGPVRRTLTGFAVFRPRKTAPADQEVVRLVEQAAALLDAGRSGPQLWAAVGAGGPLAEPHSSVVKAALRASLLGTPVSAAIRSTCERSCGRDSLRWSALAACLDVAEASGAPLAGVLHRFAGALDQDIDAAAQRETALAGPRATVRVLVWLPAVGVLLGFLMGSDPVRVLTGGPLGWLLTAGGTALIVVGRCWSAVLLGRAESV